MKTSRSTLSILTTCVLGAVGLVGTGLPLQEATAAVTKVNSSAADSAMPIYRPPKDRTPRARIDGSSRGGAVNEPGIVALVPDHVGFTIKKDPSLYWYLPQSTSLPIRFILIDSRSIQPIVDLTLPHRSEAGIQVLRLKDHGIVLDPGMQYRWFLSLTRDPDKPARDIVTGGVIERIDFNEGSALGVPVACDKDAVYRYAEAGLWYDAIACVSDLIESQPHNSSLRKQRAFLLNQIDLSDVAEYDLRQNGIR